MLLILVQAWTPYWDPAVQVMPCICGAGFFISSLWKMRTTSQHVLLCIVAMGEEQSQGNGFVTGQELATVQQTFQLNKH